jgi:hypothetical protein
MNIKDMSARINCQFSTNSENYIQQAWVRAYTMYGLGGRPKGLVLRLTKYPDSMTTKQHGKLFLKLPGCQAARLPSCQAAKLPGCQAAMLPGFQTA